MTEISFTVITSANVANEKANGTGYSTGSFQARNHASDTATRTNGGIYIPNVAIPQGSTIDSAIYKGKGGGAGQEQMDMKWYLNDVDDAATFAVEADVTSRVRTTAFTGNDTTTYNNSCFAALVDSFDWKGPLQEVVDRGGWASGNALCLLLIGQTTGAEFYAQQMTGGCTPNAKVVINFTEPPPSAGQRMFDERRKPSKLGSMNFNSPRVRL